MGERVGVAAAVLCHMRVTGVRENRCMQRRIIMIVVLVIKVITSE